MFDFVYALSVFTHLPEPLQFPWMHEMARVIRPDGFLLITTHGDHYLPEMTTDERKRFRQAQLVVRNEEMAGANTCGVYHPERYVRSTLAAECGFTVVDFVPEGAKGSPGQDVFLLQKREW